MAALQKQEEHEQTKCDVRNTVIVTGFGPFGDHSVNASWEAVRLLPTTGVEKELGICLVVEHIPVAYEDVGKKVPALWDSHNPLLVIHVGVSNYTEKLTLETCAEKSGYKRCDIYNQTPSCNECCFGTDTPLKSGLDLSELKEKINITSTEVQTELSQDAGRYLCEYIYYTSLSIDSSRSLFIHVPPLDKPYSAETLARGLADVIKCLVGQLRNRDQQALTST